MRALVRPYEPRDRAAVLQIAADTHYFGAPVEAFLGDRRITQDALVAYNVDYEPEHLWVAEAEGEVVGHISGSTGDRRAAVGKARTAAVFAFRLLTFRYRFGGLTWCYFRRTGGAGRHREYAHADLKSWLPCGCTRRWAFNSWAASTPGSGGPGCPGRRRRTRCTASELGRIKFCGRPCRPQNLS